MTHMLTPCTLALTRVANGSSGGSSSPPLPLLLLSGLGRAQCGEEHYAIADKKYQEGKTKDPKAANLAELAMNDMENVKTLCEKSKACIKAEIGG